MEKDEIDEGMCKKCCDAGRGNIKFAETLQGSCTGMYAYHLIYSRYVLMT